MFSAKLGLKLEIDVENVRPLGPDLFAERGSTRIAAADGSEESSRYVAVNAKKDGKWLIVQVTELPPAEDAGTAALRDLDWLVGQWEDEAEESKVRTTVKWSDNQAFLIPDFEVPNVVKDTRLSAGIRFTIGSGPGPSTRPEASAKAFGFGRAIPGASMP